MRLRRSHLVDVTLPPYNADRTGATDCHAAIQAAINSARKGDVVFLPAGTYLVTAPIVPRDGKGSYTVRGTGDRTLIRWAGTTGECFLIGSESDYNWPYPSAAGTAITGDYPQGATKLGVASSLGLFDGALVQLREDNDTALPVIHVSGAYDVRRQLELVVAHTAHSVTLYPGLQWGVRKALHPVLHVARRQANGVGLESFCIDARASSKRADFIIFMEQCYGCWIYNVHTRFALNYHIWAQDCLQCEIRHSFLDRLNHSGMNGAALYLFGVCDSLIENNVMTHAFPHVELNTGATGNVIAYNFCYDSISDGASGVSMDPCHAPHTSYNLFEGNAAPIFQADSFFGSSSENTAFHNWWFARQPGQNRNVRQPVLIDRFSRDYAVVGNILGTKGYPYYRNLPARYFPSNTPYAAGLPNLGNTEATGIAEPSKGRYWADWNLTGAVVDAHRIRLGRLPPDLNVGMSQFSITWGDHQIHYGGKLLGIEGTTLTFASPLILPPAGTVVAVWPGPGGYQEWDRDVQNTLYYSENADVAGGRPAPAGAPLPDSLFLDCRPPWYGRLATWPPYRGEAPDPRIVRGEAGAEGYPIGFESIPAGYRFIHHGVDPEGVSLFMNQPASVRAPAGSLVEFAVATAAEADLRWQASADQGAHWRDLDDNGFRSGCTSPTLRVTAETGLDGCQFRCVATRTSPERQSISDTVQLRIGRRSASRRPCPPGADHC